MSLNSLNLKPFLLGIIVSVVFLSVLGHMSQSSTSDSIVEFELCALENPVQTDKIDCWMSVLQSEYAQTGAEATFELFQHLYTTYNDFSDTGCHRHAHRLGDYAYYFDYRSHGDITKVTFPKAANSCGYGYYHGFIEHLIQDRPEPEFVYEQCKYLTDTLSEQAPDIDMICHHGAGHGFMIAQVDIITDPNASSVSLFTKEPFEKCSDLTAEPAYLRECQEGVFNVMVELMYEEDYGLSYNQDNPFMPCTQAHSELAHDICSVEVSRKFDSLSGYNPGRALEIVITNENESLHHRMFQIAVTAMVQHRPTELPVDIMAECRSFSSDFESTCRKAVISGIFEHGTTETIIDNMSLFCEHEQLQEEEKAVCLDMSEEKLLRFWSQSEIESFCTKGVIPDNLCRRFI